MNITNATFSALMRLLDEPAFLVFAALLICVLLVLAWVGIVEALEWIVTTDERTCMPPTSAEVMQAERDMDSVRAALTECEPSVRRVRAGGGV